MDRKARMNLTVVGWILLASSLSVVLAFQGPSTAGGGSAAAGGKATVTSTIITTGTAVSPMDSSTALDHAKLSNPLKKMKKKTTPPRRICLMVEPTPFTHVSGYANRFKEMLRFLKKAGDDVDVLTVDSKTPAKDLPSSFLGFPIRHTLGFTFPLYNHISLTFDLPEMKGAKIIETFRPDLIHVTSPGFLLFAAIFYARTMKVPLVMSYHTHLPTYGKNYLGFIPRVEKMCWELLRFAHSKADLTLVTSPQMKAELEDNGIPRVDVWRKGIDTERFHPTFQSDSMRSRMSDGNPQDFLMVYVGRLGAEKRLKDIKPILQQMPNARLCLVGKGPQMEELQEHFRGEKAVFLGQLSGDDLSSAFASADAFIMPSDSETLGFVVLESMASGVPVVGAAAGGILDLIDHGKTGYLAPPGDIPAFVHSLKELQDTKIRQRMGKSARTEAERWGWEAATNHLRTTQYDQALKNYASRNEVAASVLGGATTSWMEFLDWRMRQLARKVDRRMRGQDSVWRSLGRRIFRLPKFFGRRSVIAA